MALQSDFESVNATGLSYPGIFCLPSNSDDLPQKHDTFFRLTLPSMKLPTYIHHDAAMSVRTGILYLNSETIGGTAIWRHKESGLFQAPTPEDLKQLGEGYLNQLRIDSFDESKWEMMDLLEMKFNRFVSFDSSLFHSCYPRGGFGKDASDGRLIQVYFIQELH